MTSPVSSTIDPALPHAIEPGSEVNDPWTVRFTSDESGEITRATTETASVARGPQLHRLHPADKRLAAPLNCPPRRHDKPRQPSQDHSARPPHRTEDGDRDQPQDCPADPPRYRSVHRLAADERMSR